jgi:hypothetical protein
MTHAGARWALALGPGLSSAACGCLPIPVGTPPMTATVALGTSLPAEAGEGHESPQGLIVGRAALRPLGAVADEQERRFDLSVGYVAEVPPDEALLGYLRHGGFLGVTYVPWTHRIGNGSWFTRLGVQAMPEVLWLETADQLGGGMTFSTDLELYSYASGDVAGFDVEGGFIGGAVGEGGIGITASGGVRGIDRLRYWTLGLGMSVRLPATGGLALIPAWRLWE